MKYLLDKLNNQERYFGDMLSPVRSGKNESFMGIHLEQEDLNLNERREHTRIITDKLNTVINLLWTSPPTNSLASPTDHQSTNPPSPLSPSSTTFTPAPATPAPATITPPPPAFIITSPPGTETAPASAADSRRCPLPDILISDIDTRKGAAPPWKQALDQWYKPDPVSGLPPLRDWDREWYTGAMKSFTYMKRYERQLIAGAFEQ